MKKHILFFIAALVLFIACQKVVDADELLDTEAKVFITGYISPQDTVLRVHVSRALPAIGTPLSVQDQEANENKFLIKNAQVAISDEAGTSTELSYSEENKTYLADSRSLAITGDRRYFLKVIVEGNEFNASCTIPKKVTEINELINIKDDDFGSTEADLKMSFPDVSGTRNFYVLGGLVTTTFQFEGGELQESSSRLSFDIDEFQTDDIEDGGAISGKSTVFTGTGALQTKVTLQVANVEETLFQNLRTASANADNDGNPFVEYAITPNNIQEEGAVGVFAGYQLTEKVVDIEF